jgi:hypothetical protein
MFCTLTVRPLIPKSLEGCSQAAGGVGVSSHPLRHNTTYWPSDPKKVPDLLDFFVIRGITRNNCTIESNAELTSDHTPVIISLSTTVIKKLPPPKLTTRNRLDLFTATSGK